MKDFIEVSYDRISNPKVADYKMNSTGFTDAPFCLFSFQIIEPLRFIAAILADFGKADIFQYTDCIIIPQS
jgi:hypothetical protein